MIRGSCHCGQVHWSFEGTPETATACNCTFCRRGGGFWAYDWVNEGIRTEGETDLYMHGDKDIEFHRCSNCGNLMWWRGHQPHPDGRTRIAVNLRMAEDPAAVAGIPIHHFDGFDSWDSMPDDGRTVGDNWF